MSQPTPSVATGPDRFELDLRPDPPPATHTSPPALNDVAERPAGQRNPSPAGVTTLEHPKPGSGQPSRHVLAPTNDLIDRMWTSSRESDVIDDWTVQEMDTESSVVARRVFIGTVLTVVIAILVAAAWFVTGRGDATVDATVAQIDQASELLAETLVEAEPVILEFSSGGLLDRETAIASATALDAAARTLFGHASNLPASEEWSDLRSATVSLSDRSIATARLLSRTTSYAATIEVMFNRPAYPLTADDAEIADLAEMTAIWVSRFIATSSSLPDVNALDAHHQEIDALAATLPDWQSRYLDALRSGDVEAAGAAVSDLEDAILTLESGLSENVRSIAEELADQQSALLSDLPS